MSRTPYPSSRTDARWANIARLVPEPRPCGRPAKYPRREVVVVDTLGLVWGLLVTPASVRDGDGERTCDSSEAFVTVAMIGLMARRLRP